VNTYTVEVTLGGDYYTGYSEDVLVVYDPSLGFTTGGGWFYWPDTTDKTNFGFTMKYNKKATNIKGSLLLIAHLDDGSKYRIKSNALYGMALGDISGVGWASFSGKCTYRYPVPGSDPVNVGGQEFMAYVTDGNNPGDGVDTFWFTVLEQPFTLDAGGDNQIDGEQVEIQGGNIVVPHTPKKGGGNPHN